MKKFYLLLLASLFCLSAFSQKGKEIDTVWQHKINTVFQHLEEERVPHGILLDFRMTFTNVPAFNGELII